MLTAVSKTTISPNFRKSNISNRFYSAGAPLMSTVRVSWVSRAAGGYKQGECRERSGLSDCGLGFLWWFAGARVEGPVLRLSGLIVNHNNKKCSDHNPQEHGSVNYGLERAVESCIVQPEIWRTLRPFWVLMTRPTLAGYQYEVGFLSWWAPWPAAAGWCSLHAGVIGLQGLLNGPRHRWHHSHATHPHSPNTGFLQPGSRTLTTSLIDGIVKTLCRQSSSSGISQNLWAYSAQLPIHMHQIVKESWFFYRLLKLLIISSIAASSPMSFLSLVNSFNTFSLFFKNLVVESGPRYFEMASQQSCLPLSITVTNAFASHLRTPFLAM